MSSRFVRNILGGACGGLLGAFAMNQFQNLVSVLQSQKQESGDQQSSKSEDSDDATVKAAQSIACLWNHHLSPDEKKWAGPLVHYGFGTLTGAAYGAASAVAPKTLTAGAGSLFGGVLWLAGDEIGVPAAGLSVSPFETPLPSHVQALAAHLVYALTTEAVRKLISPPE